MVILGGPDRVSRPLESMGSEIYSKNHEKVRFHGPLVNFLVIFALKSTRVGLSSSFFLYFCIVSRFQSVLEVWKHDPVPLMWPCRIFFILCNFALKCPLVAENGDLNLKYTHLLLAYLNRYQKSFTYEFANICKSYKSCVDKFFIRCPEV